MAGEFYKPGLNDLQKRQAQKAKDAGATIDQIHHEFKVRMDALEKIFPDWFDPKSVVVEEEYEEDE